MNAATIRLDAVQGRGGEEAYREVRLLSYAGIFIWSGHRRRILFAVSGNVMWDWRP